MIQSLNKAAQRLYPLRKLFLGLAIACFILFALMTMLGTGPHTVFQLPSLVLSAWAFSLHGIALSFYHLPNEVEDGDGFFRRWKKRFKLAYATLLAVCFWLTTLALLKYSISVISAGFSRL